MSEKKRIPIQSFYSLFYFILSCLYLEIIFSIIIFHSLSISFFYTFFFDISLCFFIGIFCRLFKQKINCFLEGLFLFMISFYFCVQMLYYHFFKVFLSTYSLTHGGQVAEFYKDIIQLIFQNIFSILLCFLPFIVYLIIQKHITMKRFSRKKVILSFSMSILFFFCGFALLYLPSSSLNSPQTIYQEGSLNEVTIRQFGLMTSWRLEFKTVLFGKDEQMIETTEKPVIKEEPVYNSQIMDIDFNQLIENESNETIKKMHQYFQNVTPTMQNEYTGMFKDYNVILLTCEGFSPYAIDEKLTPTLYKLSHEGFVFQNFYTPLWHVSTSDGEYVALQGLIPKEGTWSFRDSAQNTLPFTLGRQFQKLGYTTKAYHDHSYTYYDRNLSHPNLGYDFKAVGHGLQLKKQWPESDLEMMEKTVDEYIHEEHFHTYYMTVSGHTNYTFTGNNMAAKNKQLVEDLDYSDLAKGYLATQIELDRAMEYLLKRLEEEGIADKTVIAMSADHYPYGLPYKNYCELAGHQIDQNFEIYKNSFILWSASIEKPIVIDKLGCSIDILPTLSNLFGLEYDSRLLMGTDLLSNSDSLVILGDKSFITDRVMYNAKNQTATWLDGEEDMDYLKQINTIVKQKIYYSQKILETDYYQYIQ